jgi:hypothetical protein
VVGHEGGTRRHKFGAWHQGPFPGPKTFGAIYNLLRELRGEELAATKDTPPERTKQTESKKPYNLIPACVYWYVGNRGQVLRSPRGSELKRTTRDLVKKHLLDPNADKFSKIKVRPTVPRDARVAEPHILRVDEELRLQAARIIPLMNR